MEKIIDVQNVNMYMIRGDIEVMVKFCPRCGSANIGWLIPHDRQKWECKDCGYVGAFIIEDSKMADEIRKEYIENMEK